MAQLATKVTLYVGRPVDFTTEVILVNLSDGAGDVIQDWNIVDPIEPTQAQLDALDPEATIIDSETRATLDFREAYGYPGIQQVKEIDAGSPVDNLEFKYLANKNYRLKLFNLIPVADGQNLLLKASIDNGETYLDTNTYQWVNDFLVSGADTIDEQDSPSANFISICRATESGGLNCVSNTGEGVCGTIDLVNIDQDSPLEVSANVNYYRAATAPVNRDHLIRSRSAGNTVGIGGGGAKTISTNINAFRIYFQSTGGSQIASGRAELWAV